MLLKLVDELMRVHYILFLLVRTFELFLNGLKKEDLESDLQDQVKG